MPHSTSGASLLKINAPAPAREYPMHATTTHARRSLPVPDRHRRRGLPQIPLADLPRPIHRPLERARRAEQRTDLPQIGRIQVVVATLDREELRWAGRSGGGRIGLGGR